MPRLAAEIGNYHYGQGHPMKPHRVRMTHNLVVNYGLYREMEVFRPKPVSRDQMTRFHSDDYFNFLRVINPDNMSEFLRHLQRCELPPSLPPCPSSRNSIIRTRKIAGSYLAL